MYIDLVPMLQTKIMQSDYVPRIGKNPDVCTLIIVVFAYKYVSQSFTEACNVIFGTCLYLNRDDSCGYCM